MKKYLILFAALVFAATTNVFGISKTSRAANLILKIEPGNTPKTLQIRLANLQKFRTEIAIQSTDGTVWHSQFINNKTGYSALFDLKTIADGEFILFVKNKKSSVSQGFSMNGNDFAFFQKMEAAPQKSLAQLVSQNTDEKGKLITHFTSTGGLFFDLQLANLQKQPTAVRINSLGGGSLFDEKVCGEIGYAKSINLTGAQNGQYFIAIRAGDATVVQFFSIKNNELTFGGSQRLERPAIVAESEKFTKN